VQQICAVFGVLRFTVSMAAVRQSHWTVTGATVMYTCAGLCVQAVAAAVKASQLLAAMWKHMRGEHAATLSFKQLKLMVHMSCCDPCPCSSMWWLQTPGASDDVICLQK
jgi:hypothetical protein